MRVESLFGVVTLVAELADHRLDVGEGPISCIHSTLVLLYCFHLNLHLVARLASKFLHVTAYELYLGVQVLIPLLSVLGPFLKLQVSNFKLVHDTLVLLLALLEESILVGQLTQLPGKLRELSFKLFHCRLVRLPVVLKLALQLPVLL